MGANSTLRAISEMMQISCDFSKGANPSSSGPREEVKKEKHHNLTPQMIGKSNLVQLQMFGRKRALIFTRKMVKKFHTAIVERPQKKLAMDMTRKWSDSLSLTKKRPK